MATQVAKQVDESEAKASDGVSERKPSLVSPNNVTIQEPGGMGGQKYKTFVVQMPEDDTFNDLNEHPEIWKAVQAVKPLDEDDKVEMRWRDKRVFGIVDYTINAEGKVFFTDLRLVRKKKPAQPGRKIGQYEVREIDGGFSYFRTRDDVRMSTATFPTADAAEAACQREQFPAKVR